MRECEFYPVARQHLLKDHSTPGLLLQKDLIVLHITQGMTAASAICTFETSKSPHRVSAHFVIDRDGTVYQLLPLSDVAWHASAVNTRSIGIEHAAVVGSYPATEEQYKASGALVKWICEQIGLPINRNTVKGHNEASPRDGHVLCCSGALDVDRVVGIAQAEVEEDAVRLHQLS